MDREDQGFLEVTKIHANSWPWDNFPSNFHSLKLHFMKLLAKQTGSDGKMTNSPSIQGNNLLNWQGHHRSLFHATHEGATRTFSHLSFNPCMAPALTQPLLHPRVCSKVGGKCLSFPSTIPLGKLSQGTNEVLSSCLGLGVVRRHDLQRMREFCGSDVNTLTLNCGDGCLSFSFSVPVSLSIYIYIHTHIHTHTHTHTHIYMLFLL